MVEVITKTGMPLEEFIRLNDEQPFELINGRKRAKVPTVISHSETVRALFLALHNYVTSRQLGEVYSETTFMPPDSFSKRWVEGWCTPDIMFYAGTRVVVYKAGNPDYRSNPLALVPDFVIEVISPTDKYSEVDEKVDAYLADGVRLVWVIDPQRRKATIHAPDAEQPTHLAGDVGLDMGDVIPGFQIRLATLFEG